MKLPTYSFVNEQVCHLNSVEELNAQAFGPGRHARAAARVREQGPHNLDLSFVCLDHKNLVGSVQITPIWVGTHASFLLGPLAVDSSYKKQGIGRKLVQLATDAVQAQGGETVILVGDFPYYGTMGFVQSSEEIIFPGPVDKARILVNYLVPKKQDPISGCVKFRSSL